MSLLLHPSLKYFLTCDMERILTNISFYLFHIRSRVALTVTICIWLVLCTIYLINSLFNSNTTFVHIISKPTTPTIQQHIFLAQKAHSTSNWQSEYFALTHQQAPSIVEMLKFHKCSFMWICARSLCANNQPFSITRCTVYHNVKKTKTFQREFSSL